MPRKPTPPADTTKLIYRLRLMAESGGMLSRDRIRTILDSADRLEDFQERIAIMTEHTVSPDSISFNVKGVSQNG